jgi:hypothetical protein
MRLTKTHWALIALVVVALGAVGVLPSFNSVSVRGPDGDLTVRQAGFGPGGIHVKTDAADIRVNHP